VDKMNFKARPARPGQCAVCTHPERTRIEMLRVGGVPLRAIAERRTPSTVTSGSMFLKNAERNWSRDRLPSSNSPTPPPPNPNRYWITSESPARFSSINSLARLRLGIEQVLSMLPVDSWRACGKSAD
jgi:hypothetical protein